MYPGSWAKKMPDRPAVINIHTDERVSYRQLDQHSNQFARLMREKGLRKKDHIAVFMENNIKLFEIVWAALRSGLYITPINRYLTAEEAGYILKDCRAQVLVVSSYMGEVARELLKYADDCHTRLMIDGTADGFASFEEAIATYPAAGLPEEPCGTFLLYSSGTTGSPKGVYRPLPEMSVEEYYSTRGMLQSGLWGFDENAVYLSPAPLYHAAPLSFSVNVQALGGTVVMMQKFDALEALRGIEKYRVTHSQWVPTMFSRMLKLPEQDRKRFDLSSLKVAIHSAAPCPQALKKQMLDWWGPVIYEYYASTEMSGFAHVGPEEWLAHPGTVGKPVFGVFHICDEDGNELSPGEPGYIYSEWPEMPFSYHNDKVKTDKARHPLHDNWCTIGDIGYLDEEGYLYLTDRASFMIISGGVNIYPQEVENILIMHEKVSDVAVIGVPNEDMGEEVKAVVVVADNVKPDSAVAEQLLSFTRDRLAHYKCPKTVDFVHELPRTPTGKLLKHTIRDPYWNKP